jgi:hypothetical protein
MAVEKQELHCHNCDKYIQFEVDTELNGNHILKCPNCGHEHCRVVKDGKITGDRWDQRNGNTYQVQYASWTQSSTWTIYNKSNSTGSYFLYTSWSNSTTCG